MQSIRTCVICKKKRQKPALHRIAIVNNEIVIDTFHRLCNFGYYICKDSAECWKLAHTLLKRSKIKKVNV